MITITSYQSPIGPMTIATQEEYLIGVWFDGQKYDKSTILGKEYEWGENATAIRTKRWLEDYFSGKKPTENLPINIEGSSFQKMVIELIREIPYGQTRTYGEIAGRIAERTGRKSMSAQAVGGAVGHNPISIIVPCHRVLGKNGAFTGYAGGVERKEYLLRLEERSPL